MWAALEDTLSVRSRAGLRELLELQGPGKGGKSRGGGDLERGFWRSRIGLSRGEVSESIGVLSREIFANPHFLGPLGSRCCPCATLDLALVEHGGA